MMMKTIILSLLLAMQVNSVVAVEPFVPKDNGGPDTTNGSGTRLQDDDCPNHRGGGRIECQSLILGVN